MENNFGGCGLIDFGVMAPFCLHSKTAKISLQTMDYIVHGGQKIELAQKIHVSRGQLEMHGKQFWWAWPYRFRSYGSFLLAFKNGKNFPSDHGL